eukprot:g18770.t1
MRQDLVYEVFELPRAECAGIGAPAEEFSERHRALRHSFGGLESRNRFRDGGTHHHHIPGDGHTGSPPAHTVEQAPQVDQEEEGDPHNDGRGIPRPFPSRPIATRTLGNPSWNDRTPTPLHINQSTP